MGAKPFLKQFQWYAAWNEIFTATDELKFIQLFGFRMEKVDWRTSRTLAKAMGTIVSIGGAFILTYYRGPPVLMTHSPLNASPQRFMQLSNWVIGGSLLAVDCVMASAWIIIQVKFLKTLWNKKINWKYVIYFWTLNLSGIDTQEIPSRADCCLFLLLLCDDSVCNSLCGCRKRPFCLELKT